MTPEGRGGTVLIVEDDPGVARLERLRLERAGYAAIVASSAEEALLALDADGIDLMLLDYKLPGQASGIDFHHQARAAGHDVPAILVTGFGDEEMLAQALRAGLRDFLPKTPDYLDFLVPTVDRVIGQVRTERALAARQRMLEHERQRSQQLQRLAAASSRLAAALDVEAVLRLLAEEARALIGAGRALAGLAPEGDWSRAVHASAPAGAAPPGAPEGPAADVCRSNRPARLDEGARGWLAAPLVGRRGRNIGLVQLFDRVDGPFTEGDEAILVQIAQMAGVAVENARLDQELRDNDRRKDEFLAMLAHELRNPLAAIDGAVQVAEGADADEHLAWAREVIGRQTKQLSRLIDDLLDVSRITQGKIQLRKEPLDLAAAVARAVESVRPQVDASRHALEVDVGPGPLPVEADPSRIEQVLGNLLTNAAKYTPDGGRIRLSARREGGEVVVEVEDSGVGIDPEMLPRIFDAFTQVEQTIDRSQGGLGIGLTLVRRLVEMHGGSVAARSGGPGRGSTFTVRLPAADGTAAPRAGREGPASRDPSRPRPRVLVVDDSADTARAMARLLGVQGYDVRVAHDGRAAIDAAREHRPDVILLDIGLPGLNGYEVARAVRRDPGLAGVTLIAISGYGQDHDRRRSADAGFDHHLVKPVDYGVLYELLDAVPGQTLGA
ncbi:MAG TPA: response regulator [Isosphaeraceae bacterium]